jgi:hypothetical protein
MYLLLLHLLVLLLLHLLRLQENGLLLADQLQSGRLALAASRRVKRHPVSHF